MHIFTSSVRHRNHSQPINCKNCKCHISHVCDPLFQVSLYPSTLWKRQSWILEKFLELYRPTTDLSMWIISKIMEGLTRGYVLPDSTFYSSDFKEVKQPHAGFSTYTGMSWKDGLIWSSADGTAALTTSWMYVISIVLQSIANVALIVEDKRKLSPR